MLTSLSDIKTYLGIHWNWQDARLTLLQTVCEAYVKKFVWNVLAQNYTERVKYSNTYHDGSFFLQNTPVNSISNIGGTAFSWVLWTDYVIEGKRVMVYELSKYFPTNNRFDSYTITYNAWYVSVPEDIKLAIYMLVWAEYSKDAWQWIKREKLWEREIEYDLWANPNILQVKQLLTPYYKHIISLP